MKKATLTAADLDSVMDLFCRCFSEDHYYAREFPDETTRRDEMRTLFYPCVSYCIEHGFAVGVKDGERLTAFVICFDYPAVRREDAGAFRMIFTGSESDSGILPYDDAIHARIRALGDRVMYCLSIAVDPDYRGMGMASALIDLVLRTFPDHYLVSDVSNEASLKIYRQRNFLITSIETDYFLIVHRPGDTCDTFEPGEEVRALVPALSLLEEHDIAYRLMKTRAVLIGVRVRESCGIPCFKEDADAVVCGSLVSLSYEEYLKFQRLINVAHYRECIRGNFVYYRQIHPYACPPLMNEVLEEMVKIRKREWSLIPDVYVSVPMQYDTIGQIRAQAARSDERADWLLKNLDFCTHYEAGIPSGADNVDELAWFKQRLERIYLGKLTIQIESEITVEHYEELGDPVGAPALVDLYVTVDRGSNCAVLTWYSLSAPFLISHLMDNVIRNQVMTVPDGTPVNLFDYLKERFGIVKRGTPKIFAVIPKEKSCLDESQLSSLLVGETIYPEGESFGKIIDPDIVSIVRSQTGMGQYDRAFVCAYTNVVLQFSPDFMATLRNRIGEEAITLFYMEMVLIEEAAIQITDRAMITLFSSDSIGEPVDFLREVDRIYDEYSRTVEFWDLQMNYPTSQKSVDMLRSAFRIREQLEFMQRNAEQLQTVFQTKSDLVDRSDARRMNISLAIISVLAVFSAWIDGYDYIATWTDVFSPTVIYVLQKILFVAILVTAGYAAYHLFWGRRKKK